MLTKFFKRPDRTERALKEPIRAELFGIERLEQHAESLAAEQPVGRNQFPSRALSSRLRSNARALLKAYRTLASVTETEQAITPAAEWLIDNFHIVEEQIRDIRSDLPAGFYRQLPKLSAGPLKGYPRIYGVAWAFIAHTDSRFDAAMLCRFVNAYQRVEPLTIGELWAIAVTLRLILVENLRRLADRILLRRADRHRADLLVDQILGLPPPDERELPSIYRGWEGTTISTSFAVQVLQRLRDQDAKVMPALRWLDEQLRAQHTDAEEAVRMEHNSQGASNLTVRNIITSMRLISTVDWKDLVETMSTVDVLLRAQTAFADMDFPTRNLYRSAIENLARRSDHSELQVAGLALAAASESAAGDPSAQDRRGEPGYYLVGNGRRDFEKDLGYRPPARQWLQRASAAAGVSGYLLTVAAVTALIALAGVVTASDPGGQWPLWLFALLALIPASDMAIALVNAEAMNRFATTIVPGLALRQGVPVNLRTMVVVPTLLTDPDSIAEQVERLEVHYLSNSAGELYFALLSDWADAPAESAENDQQLLTLAMEGVARLNQRHVPLPGGPRFLLLHRRRIWNESQQCWIGWERKRGKLHELNRLLRGAMDTSFVPLDGQPPAVPTGVRYVITLDADTRLPIGAAKRLIGKMAHPQNRPKFDPGSRRVVEGHGILQPRVTPSLPNHGKGTWFQRIFSSASGIDPYAFAVSDVYQDLFEEGSYSGKGIYDVDAFEAAMAGRIPDGTILSHDLFEGIFARAGLASDVEVIEEYPSRYDIAAARQHRWARGDWQLFPWIAGRPRVRNRDRTATRISVIGRWKMLDNLRRTLSAPIGLVSLVVGSTLPPTSAALWSGFIALTIGAPALLPFLSHVLPRASGTSKRAHLFALFRDFQLTALQITLLVTFLAHQAWLMMDAILRTMYRVAVSRRNLLQWVTAAQTENRATFSFTGFYRQMSGAIILSVLAGAFVAVSRGPALPGIMPLILLWAASPAIARLISMPPRPAILQPASAEEAKILRLFCRRTWRYFETFVTADDSMLPPDNFQETPAPVIAHRTSPTNIGLYLLSAVAARDFGWVGGLDSLERLEATLSTMHALERIRGHYYNWYDTRDLRPLEPKYISSVDSGNLAGHLVALANASRERLTQPIVDPHWSNGFEDHLALLAETLGEQSAPTKQHPAFAKIASALETTSRAVDPEISQLGELDHHLRDLLRRAGEISAWAKELASKSDAETSKNLVFWSEALHRGLSSHLRDLDELVPWIGRAAPTSATAPLDCSRLSTATTVSDLARICGEIAEAHREKAGIGHASSDLLDALKRSTQAARTLEGRLADVARQASEFFDAMKFDFLFDSERQLLSIGYRMADGMLDSNCYDLLASEARLASFIAIAKGEVPAANWFRLGRTLTPIAGQAALISWSGSMFEYLMPSLVMRAPAGSLLEQTSRLVVRRQRDYAANFGAPWGISESAYNARDLQFTYQYSNFGVPGLGLKRGLRENFVVAPYATALAAMVDPAAAAMNLLRLVAEGGRGAYGWYEALDYTPTRLLEGQRVAIVQAYMAHHAGMSLVAIANALQAGKMRRRFHADPLIQAAELLLQERPPRDVAIARPRVEELSPPANVRDMTPPMPRQFHSPHDPIPRSHLLSNGRYAVMVTSAGSGYSRWHDMAVTRWREDITLDNWGSYVYLRDCENGDLWSAAYQPSGTEPHAYSVSFSEDKAEFTREDDRTKTTLEIGVSPEDDAEVRRVSITNLGRRAREIEFTSYAELVLATPGADIGHPAFSKMFVETEYVENLGVLLATRRRRSAEEREIWAAHLAVIEGESQAPLQFETDRVRFIGRGRNLRSPRCIVGGDALSNTVGTVLDPVFSLRCRLRVPPGATARVAFWTLVAPTRAEALDLADKHRDPAAYERALTLAWTQAQVQLRHLDITSDEAQLFQRLANRLIYSDPSLRPSSDSLMRNSSPPPMLWQHGISGDLPIVLLRIDEIEELGVLRQLLRAREYWRMKQLPVDLVIINERPPSYNQDVHSAIEVAIRINQSREPPPGEGPRGGVFALRGDLLSIEVRILLQSIARAVIVGRHGTLAEQVRRLRETRHVRPLRRKPPPPGTRSTHAPVPKLEYFNGLGGFTEDGREYVTILDGNQSTPMPWINVIANETFGFNVSAEGSSYTWSLNSRENQITPWSNDPVSDPPGEALYLRDEETGEFWTATALPVWEDDSPYVARHGQGYSRFEHSSRGVALELLQFVPLNDSIKISRLKVTNKSAQTRRLSATAYVEWAFGIARGASAPHVVTEVDPDTRVLLARNRWRIDFGPRVAFMDLCGRQSTWTGDRTEFIGRNGTLEAPAALVAKSRLSNRTGAGLDPCGVLQTTFTVEPGGSVEIDGFLGDAPSREEALALVARYRKSNLDEALEAVRGFWDDVLGTVEVRTPDRTLDLMMNRWMLYQTLSCRVLARTAFYQVSGAYGFRDQLQDVVALTIAAPSVTRAHLLRAAARQFAEGDVQHWWLPESGRGVRTRISDDRAWLAYAVSHYVRVSGDTGVLAEMVPFLQGPALHQNENESFYQPMVSEKQATLYDHCTLALDQSLTLGPHELPLFGTGDWNDGMNRVGVGGKGESVWLAWFHIFTLREFSAIAESRGDLAHAERWRQHAATLCAALEREAWDGAWYRRGFYDDGTPLGSAPDAECRINSIAQSWSVISGAAQPHRAAQAVASALDQLYKPADHLSLLLTPPFDRGDHDPGYIKGYPPGIRENGGQYSHAATWFIYALALLGDGDKAGELASALLPINHASSPDGIRRYKVEPYVISADVYAAPLHVGRGGWTWYTGSAGWAYRAILESILGFHLQASTLTIDPCIPRTWPGFEMVFHYHAARYEIAVVNPEGVCRGVAGVELDGESLAGKPFQIPLVKEGGIHRIRVALG